MPVRKQALEEVGPAQERAVLGRRAAEHHVVASARAGMPAVDHEFLRHQPAVAGGGVEPFGLFRELRPARRRVDVDLDHSGVRYDLDIVQSRIRGRQIALQDDRHEEGQCGRLHGSEERKIVIGTFDRRKEDGHIAAPRLDAEGDPDLTLRIGADRPGQSPGLEGKRHAKAHRRVPGNQEHPAGHEPPRRRGPAAGFVASDREGVADRRVEAGLQHHPEPRPLGGVVRADLRGVVSRGDSPLLPDMIEAVLIARDKQLLADAQELRERGREAAGVCRDAASGNQGIGQQPLIAPKGLTVLAPEARENPAGKGFPGIPFALPVMNKAALPELGEDAPEQPAGELPLVRAQRCRVPLGPFHAVHGDEGRFAADREPDVLFAENVVDLGTHGVDGCPRFLLVGQRDPRRFEDAPHGHCEFEGALAFPHDAADRRRAGRLGRACERQVTFARQEPGGRIESDPSRAGKKHFAPSVQVRKVAGGARSVLARLNIVAQLDQVPRCEAGGESDVPEHLHEEPRRIAAGAAAERQRLVRRLHAVLKADDVPHRAADAQVEGDQEFDCGAGREVDALQECVECRCGAILAQEGRQLDRELRLVRERGLLGRRIQKEVKGVQDRHLGDQVHLDREQPCGLRKDQPCAVVALQVLLPVDEMLSGLDLERVTEDGGAAMGRGLQPDRLRPQHDRRIVAVGRAVV